MTTVGANRLGDCIQSSTIAKFEVCLSEVWARRRVVQALFEKCIFNAKRIFIMCPISDADPWWQDLSSTTIHPCLQIKTVALDMKDLTTNGVRILAQGIRHSIIESWNYLLWEAKNPQQPPPPPHRLR
jgi:hypothetical protein